MTTTEATTAEASTIEAAGTTDDVVERGDADPPASTPGGTDLEFRPDIEGLRAVAIILVVLYHCGIAWMPGGFVGVDVFFVLSGFLITGLLLREHERRGRVSLPGFYARRSRRILPAAMLVIIATILLAHHFQNFLDYGFGTPPGNSTQAAGRWASIFAANIHYGDLHTSYFNPTVTPSPLTTYWSLAVEEQFYVVWPTIVLAVGWLTVTFLKRVAVTTTVLVVATAATIASFVWSMKANSQNASWAYYSPLTRAWELGIGAMAASLLAILAARSRRIADAGGAVLDEPAVASPAPRDRGAAIKWGGVVLAWLGIGAILLSACSTTISLGVNTFPPTRALLPVLGSVAVILGGAAGLGAGWLLGYKPERGTGRLRGAWCRYQRANPMRLVGRVSYGWYLLHYPPMILWVGVLYLHPLPVHERLLIAVITLGIAFVMYYVLEKPIRRSRALAARPWVSIAMGLALVATAFCVSALYHKGLFG